MKEPTEEQIRELWEWCGFRWIPYSSKKINGVRTKLNDAHWIYPNGLWSFSLPPIDLNNLFKYAVPKVNGWRVVIYQNAADGYTSYIDSNGKCRMWEKTLSSANTPALALFWAIHKVIKEKE